MSCYHDGMIRTQIQLTEEQLSALRKLSAEQGRSVADLIRNSVDHMLADSGREARGQRFLDAAGRFHSSAGDVSENHDKYLAEDFA